MNIYNFSFKTHQGEEVNLSSYAGCVLLLVNTATKCGLAPQFRELEVLHKKYQDSGLVVIGFPCEQFLGQESETNETVAYVCEINFGVTFLLSEKIEVNGKNTHPLFAYLKKTLPSGFLGDAIKWNFTKFLIDRNGVPYKRYGPLTKPRAFEKDIEKLLE